MSLARFRIRTMMVVVAVAAVTLMAWRLHKQSRSYQATATLAAQFEAVARKKEQALRRILRSNRGRTLMVPVDEEAELLAAHADRMARLKSKYERAARYPWLPVEPDPPEPEPSTLETDKTSEP